MKNSRWNTTGDIDWDQFSPGGKYTFIEAIEDFSTEVDGFRFSIRGFIDSQGRFYSVGHEISISEVTEQ